MSHEFQLALSAQALAELLFGQSRSVKDACLVTAFLFSYYYKCTSSQQEDLTEKLVKHWDWNLVAG